MGTSRNNCGNVTSVRTSRDVFQTSGSRLFFNSTPPAPCPRVVSLLPSEDALNASCCVSNPANRKPFLALFCCSWWDAKYRGGGMAEWWVVAQHSGPDLPRSHGQDPARSSSGAAASRSCLGNCRMCSSRRAQRLGTPRARSCSLQCCGRPSGASTRRRSSLPTPAPPRPRTRCPPAPPRTSTAAAPRPSPPPAPAPPPAAHDDGQRRRGERSQAAGRRSARAGGGDWRRASMAKLLMAIAGSNARTDPGGPAGAEGRRETRE